jgi:phospholipid transport system transporter-binding protein
MAGLRAIEAGQTDIDLSQLTAVDSSAVAALLAWKRAASVRDADIRFSNLPSNLVSLVELYGVADLLHRH